jgi:putative FmdB family regulatory protein
MPIYEYRCENGHAFEVFQSMSDDPVAECIECGAACERVLSAPAVHFKGSGFYTTDYARKGAKKAAATDSSGEKSSSDSGGESKSKTETSSSSSKSSDD